ncbi:ferredoxin-type protein NapF [Endozoicomonas sp. 8E]|uniref:ferredoxin-type protein NapF n=1 Tax=Endozoicomonas sp. 8E TaxID=3035692 RepID=UPI0029390224|nr:ferredoxin-type protein NapF [Endozoicomonas sp. 8E]WOG29666.1 ferredoxin-type protein NapF [Endozoicomonas sp. 8E]
MSQKIDLDRRGLLTGKFFSSSGKKITHFSRSQLTRRTKPIEPPARPPWSLQEELFTDLCSRCGQCLAVCKTGLLIQGSGGFPEADFRKAGCSFCGACLKTCPSGAIDKHGETPWQLKPLISDQCLAMNQIHCRTCSEVCDPTAIQFRYRPGGIAGPAIDPDPCTACGDCVSSCPVDAIAMTARESANAHTDTTRG